MLDLAAGLIAREQLTDWLDAHLVTARQAHLPPATPREG
jgi:hypothetical protein